MKKICEECGCEFETSRKDARWCNKDHIRTCLICGKLFSVTRQQLVDNKQCCSRHCSQIYAQRQQQASLSNVTKICAECGKSFVPTNPNQRYCTDIHYRPCPICGEPVEVKRISDLTNNVYRTCSPDCERKLLSQSVSNVKLKQSPKYSKCIICGKDFILHWPYAQKTCSSSCRGKYRQQSGISKVVYEKAKQTNLSRYGVANIGSDPAAQAKAANTCIQRYGNSKVLRLSEFQEKAKTTVRKHYGVDHPIQNSEISAKAKETCFKRYGVDNYFKSKTNLQSVVSDSSKLDNWISFKEDPITYIESNFNHKPNIQELCDDLGVTDTRIYDYIVDCGGQKYMARYSSILESEVVAFLKSLDLGCNIIQHDRKQIAPYELDIYLPQYNLAIECNPTITHNSSFKDQFGGSSKPSKYHKMKSDMCVDKGIFLFHIFGWDWKDHKDIIKSMLSHILGKSKTVYARNCNVREASYEETKKFLNDNHRQGFATYKYSICLCSNSGEILSLMTFGKLRISQGRKHDDANSLELIRFCNKLNITVVGGASKLFKYFVSAHEPEFSKIISFSDVAHTRGNLYSILGFHQVSVSAPGYVWANPSNEKVLNRVACQKKNLRKLFNDDSIDIENKTEKQIMEEHGFAQVFDSGVVRWEYTMI